MALKQRCDAVFEGGGIRGIGLAGGVYQMERNGYRFGNVAGSSAGAIVASLVAAGYTGQEIYIELKQMQFLRFKEKHFLDYFGFLGKTLSVLFHFGIYSTNYFEQWLTELLSRKGVRVFGDLQCSDGYGDCKYKLQVTASDITNQTLLVLPGDLSNFGLDPESFSIAKAVRMSMSIPVFYEPYILKDINGRKHYIVDGGMLSNYPMWILDNGKSEPEYPIFGFRFQETKLCTDICKSRGINFIEYMKQLAATMLDSYDNAYISESMGDFQRCIQIPVTIEKNGKAMDIRSTDFMITKQVSEMLFQHGVHATEKFLDNWNFIKWKNEFRAQKNK